MWERRSKVLFLLSLSTSICLLAQMALYIVQGFTGQPIGYNLFLHCTALAESLGLAWVVYVLDAVVVFTLLLVLWGLCRQLFFSYRANRKLDHLYEEELSRRLAERYGLEPREIQVVDHPDAIALTMGLFRPKIVLSTGLMQMLELGELEAIVHHERFHLKHRDPLKTLLMSGCANILWYIPILNWSSKQYVAAREVLADASAIRTTGEPGNLGSALLKLLKRNQVRSYAFAYASFAETSINYRIQQLIDPQAVQALQLPLKRIMVSLPMAAVLSAMFLTEFLYL
ncbi:MULTISPECIES: M56 family metallopeptidase [Paenibacillus]|uniref:M56 family metallopeptidase n=1 Tax=Paenibacillus TaxID=44249 RepID=UPI0022B88C65|nr:M56 family metallopeptidase [Paenibacillus caseinilyticus]MCZ8522089.1 M56 family metallopeptidase [Paenibacillus caseinilyticus]